MAVTRSRRAPAIARDYALALRWRAAALRSSAVPGAWASGTRHPVVLVPGVWEPWQFLREIGERLHEAGHPVHVVPEVRRNSAPIPDVAATVHAAIERLDLRHVRLVAHSKGGLIGKHILANLDVPTGSALAGAANVQVPYIGHFGVLTDERVIAEVLEAVGS